MKEHKKYIVKIVIYVVMFLLISGVSVGTGLFDSFTEVGDMINIRLSSIMKVIMMVCLVMTFGNLVRIGLSVVKTDNKRINTFLTIVSSLMKYVLAIVMICWGLTILGVNVGTIFASIGLLALIVGFGAESLIADVITGLFMIFENQYNVGDIIEVAGFRGRVQSIGIRTTAIVDSGENVKVINNSAMTNILNRSTDISKAVCDISVPYEVDLEELEKKLPNILQDIQKKNSDVLKKIPTYVGVQQLADSAVILRFVAEVNEKEIYSAVRIMNRGMYLALKGLKIDIPYPQIDVHTK